MTTITRFTKEQLIAQAKNNLIGLKNYVTVYPERAESEALNIRLAEIALASLEAEADAVCQHQWKSGGANKLQRQKQCVKCGRVELAAQPAPVVPVEMRNRFRAEGLAELLKDARDYAPLTSEQWETLTNNWHQTFVGLSGENDSCRAAMLQGSQPVSNRDELPVSEIECDICGFKSTDPDGAHYCCEDNSND